LAREAGYEVSIVGDDMEDEARTLAIAHARMARSHTNPGVPRLILSGGEATVTLGDKRGVGGPNQEFALALALALAGERNVHALACDTDGIDGGAGEADDPAGAIISSRTLERAAALGLNAQRALDEHDAGTFFSQLGDLVMTGPTLTNVNDFRAILVST
jgi:hydroxypyruvate reductase